jgi:hypothetical protein
MRQVPIKDLIKPSLSLAYPTTHQGGFYEHS